ncbi:unnamed protein product [Orchesella dallaii]|uniref:C2H2-type domain-containing protein n=1 Tax=Orchesella dallaii TaxID=48710 RepID=A0ABP1PJ48_9HEXA
MEENMDEEEEQLIETLSLLPSSSPLGTWEDGDDPLALTTAHPAVNKDYGEATLTKTLRRGSRRRKGVGLIGAEIEGVEEHSKISFFTQTPSSSISSSPKNIIKVIILPAQDELVKQEAKESPAEREARLEKIREQRRRRLAKETDAEKADRVRKARERRTRLRARETEAEKVERLRKTRVRNAKRSTKEQNATETKAEMRASRFFAWEAKKASLTPEEVKQAEFHRKMNQYMRYVAWKAKFTPEEWKTKQKQFRSRKTRFADLPVEKKKIKMEKRKAYMKRIPIERKKKYHKTAMTNYINKLKQTNPDKLQQYYGNIRISNRNRIARETPEERQKRLLRYKVYQAKRKAKIQLEEEGILTNEEIKRRLEEVVKQVEKKDRLEREKKPVDPAEYKPRQNARKPKKKNNANKSEEESCSASPSPAQVERPSISLSSFSLSTRPEKRLEASSSSSKHAIKIIIPVPQDVFVKEEVEVKNDDDFHNHPEHHDQDQDNSVQSNLNQIIPMPSSSKNAKSIELSSSVEIGEAPKKRNRNPCQSERRLRQIKDNERRRKKRATESPAEKEERLRRRREQKLKEKACLSQEEIMKQRLSDSERMRKHRAKQTEAEKEECLRKSREYRRANRANETEEEKEERLRNLNASKYFEWEAKKASLTPEEVAQAEFHLKMKRYMGYVAWKAKFTAEEWKEKQKRPRRFANLPVEKKKVIMEKQKAYMKRIPIERRKKYHRTAMTNYINKLKQTNPDRLQQYYGNIKIANRNRIARETAEERQKRLLRYKVYQAKRKAKIQMEKEGVLTQEEMERRLEEVKRQVEENDRLEREKKLGNPAAEYKPRQNARKPKKKNKPSMEHSPSPSPLQQEDFFFSKEESQSSSLSSQAKECFEPDYQSSPLSPAPLESIPEEASFCTDDETYDDQMEMEAERSTSPPFQEENSPQNDFPSSLPFPFDNTDDDVNQIEALQTPSGSGSSPSPPENEIRKKVHKKTICEECGLSLNKSSMKEHKHLFHNPTEVSLHKCPKCEKEFATAKILFDHFLNLHDNGKIPTNSSRQQDQDDRDSVLIEIKKESKRPFICKECGKDFKYKTHCKLHIQKVHLGERIVCEVCGKEEQTLVNLWSHKVEKHPEIDTPPPKGLIICEYCSKPMLSNLPDHLRAAHPDKYQQFVEKKQNKKIEGASKINCPECNASIRFDSLKRHMRNVHGCGSKAFPCQHCGKEFKEKYHLNEHIRLLHTLDSFDKKVEEMKLLTERKDEDGETLTFCSLCNEKLFRRKDIGGHLLSSHLQVFEELNKKDYVGEFHLWKCVYCSELPNFESQQQFFSHVKSCHPEKAGDYKGDSNSTPWKCVECENGPSFENEQEFQSHVQSSHPKKKSYCTQRNCYKLFSSRMALRLHHEKEHPHAKFRKPLCHMDSSFRYRVRRISCSFCKALFLRRTEMMEHVKTLHPESYFPCPHCQLVGFTEKQLLDEHLAKRHKNLVVKSIQVNSKMNKKKQANTMKLLKKTAVLVTVLLLFGSLSGKEDDGGRRPVNSTSPLFSVHSHRTRSTRSTSIDSPFLKLPAPTRRRRVIKLKVVTAHPNNQNANLPVGPQVVLGANLAEGLDADQQAAINTFLAQPVVLASSHVRVSGMQARQQGALRHNKNFYSSSFNDQHYSDCYILVYIATVAISVAIGFALAVLLIALWFNRQAFGDRSSDVIHYDSTINDNEMVGYE